MPPSCAIDSTISTPGSVGRPGKWPPKNASSPASSHVPVAETPGSTARSSVTKRKGGRWGRTSAGRGSCVMGAVRPTLGPRLAGFLRGCLLGGRLLDLGGLLGCGLLLRRLLGRRLLGRRLLR